MLELVTGVISTMSLRVPTRRPAQAAIAEAGRRITRVLGSQPAPGHAAVAPAFHIGEILSRGRAGDLGCLLLGDGHTSFSCWFGLACAFLVTRGHWSRIRWPMASGRWENWALLLSQS